MTALNVATILGMIGIAATGVWLFALLRPVTDARTIALNLLYPTAQLLFVAFFRWALDLSRTTPDAAMMLPLPVCCAVCIVGNVLMFPNLPLNERGKQFEREAEQLLAATEASLRDLRERRADIDRVSQWRNGVDMRIAALRQALDRHDLPAAEHATDLIADAAGRGRARICDHPAANALLLAECERMRELGITVDCAAEIPQDIGIDGASLCAVIGNLVDNAITACSPAAPAAPAVPAAPSSPASPSRMSDSPESDIQTPQTTPQVTDSPESDNHSTDSAPQMTDSGESDTEAPWVRIRIGVGNADQGGNAGHDGSDSRNGEVLTVRVSNAYDVRADHVRNSTPGFGDHGWGMRIVDQIACQQHGTFAHGVGENLRRGPCWYAIATLACTAKPTQTSPAAPSNSAALASPTNIADPADSADRANPAIPVDPAPSAAIPAAQTIQTTPATQTTQTPQIAPQTTPQAATAKDRP